MSRSFIVLPLGAAVLAACSSSASVPRLHQPDRIDAFCGDRVAIVSAIESIVASTSDAPQTAGLPSEGSILKTVRDTGGVVAHWNDQPLYLPKTAKLLGTQGDYVTLGDAAIRSDAGGAESRKIYLTLKTKTGPKTISLQAFDVQDVCNEGKLKS
jgi:hypothetical protein